MPEYRAKALRLAFGLAQLVFRSQWSEAHRQVIEDLVDALAGYAAALARAAIDAEQAEQAAPAQAESAEERGLRQFAEWKRRQKGGGHGRA